jgi:hypothetical protein
VDLPYPERVDTGLVEVVVGTLAQDGDAAIANQVIREARAQRVRRAEGSELP